MKHLVSVLVIVSIILVLVLSVSAQDEEPARTGLRPDAPAYAIRGPYPVGTQEILIEDGHERSLIGTVWYPALNPEGLEEAVTYTHEVWPGPFLGKALLDAAPDASGGPYPLVIYSHGRTAFRQSSLFAMEHLASHGFVVMAVEYEDNFATFGTDAYYTSYVSRPDDVTRQIDFAETLTESGVMAGMIDTGSVAVTGHSFGGMTALAAAGAQLDLVSYFSWCEQNEWFDAFGVHGCQALSDHLDDLATLAGLNAVPDGLWPGRGDGRVGAVVGFAPSLHVMGPQGTQAVTVPTMFLVGTGESLLDETFMDPFDGISSEYKTMVQFGSANHYIYMNDCGDAPGFIEAGFHVACSDAVWDMARVHDLINHFTTAFLLAHLTDDADAMAALMPDAVAFPGVTYTATMP